MLCSRSLRNSMKTMRMARSCATSTSNTVFKRENIPTFGFVTGVVALSVQLFLLYPWHHVLSEQFNALQEKVLLMEKDAENVAKKLDDVLKLEVEVKTKERIILDASERILLSQTKTQEKVDSLIAMAQERKKQDDRRIIADDIREMVASAKKDVA